MNSENTKKLLEKYPEIFNLVTSPGNAPHYPISLFIFECGDGWYNIIDSLCAAIKNREYNQKLNKKQFAPVVATQVKEKYGGLRFYYSGGDDYIDGAVVLAEYLSEMTCEKCGAPGKMRGRSWVYTACDEHTREEDKQNE